MVNFVRIKVKLVSFCFIYNIYIFGSVYGVSHRDTEIGDSNDRYPIILSSLIILAACQGGFLVLNLT